MTKLTEEFKKRIEQTIAEVEKNTSVEFVPVITHQSSSYLLWRVVYCLLVFSFTLTILILNADSQSVFTKLSISLALSAVVGLGTFANFFLRAILSHHVKLHAVEEKAHHVFLHEEIFDTRHRTGVLIYISEFEQAVYILADKGFSEKVKPQEWAELGGILAKDFSKRSEGETFLLAIDKLAKRLSPDFPPYKDEKPHLSGKVMEV